MSECESASLDTVIADLQAEIHKHRLALSEGGILDQPEPLARVRQTQWVNPHLPIGWPEMPKRLIPKISAYAQKIIRRLLRWYINPIIEQQNSFNAAVAESLSHLNALAADIQEIQNSPLSQNHAYTEDATAQTTEYDTSGGVIAATEDRLTRQQTLIAERVTQASLTTLRSELLEHDWGVIRQHQEADHQAETRNYAEQLKKASAQLQQSLEPVKLRLQRLETRSRQSWVKVPSQETPQTSPNIDYFLLGAQYRNNSQMAQRLSDYDDLLGTRVPLVSEAPGLLPVVDIGCGRGEMVAHLNELGYKAYGVDIDADAISLGRSAGLDVRIEDGFAHLKALEDASLAGVVAFQIMEHLTIEDNVRFYKLISQKLTAGGFILIETINPVCLWALTNHYLLDPSHRTPLHPQMTQFLLEQAGYWQVKIRYLHPVPDSERLRWVAARNPDDSAAYDDTGMRSNIERLNAFLYGPQDYAAFALKPKE